MGNKEMQNTENGTLTEYGFYITEEEKRKCNKFLNRFYIPAVCVSTIICGTFFAKYPLSVFVELIFGIAMCIVGPTDNRKIIDDNCKIGYQHKNTNDK